MEDDTPPMALFRQENDRFVPSRAAASPWGEGLMHGGPPAALLARAVQRLAIDASLHLARLTVDLLRPVPLAPLEVEARTVRAGRRLQIVQASLFHDGVEVSRGNALLLRRSDAALFDETIVRPPPPGPEGIVTEPLAGGGRSAGRREGFHTTIEVRRVAQTAETGRVTAWLRVPLPLVAGEPLDPLVRVAATCDFVNALSRSGDGKPTVGFINADSTISLQRIPAGEWIALEVERLLDPHGIGVATATLFDTAGAFGRATQSLLANHMT